MTTRHTFHSKPEHLERAHTDSTTVEARPATLQHYGGGTEPGVAIMTTGRARITLTLDGAWALAEQLAEVVDHLNSNNQEYAHDNR